MKRPALPLLLMSVLCTTSLGAEPRARDLGVPFEGEPGAHNAITDVAGVLVGYSTIIEGESVRTGVTAVLPRGRATSQAPVFAGLFSLNGNGELTGSHWIEESGLLEGPIMLTNTHSVGVVHDAVIRWRVKQGDADESGYWWSLPVVGETWDGWLNDINGFHVKPEHAVAALESAAGGPLAEGNVGGGAGMICHQFKCGSGTSSRIVRVGDEQYALGVFVQANYGVRGELRIAGAPVGQHLQNDLAYETQDDQGSIIVVIATDAPLLPHQLKRLARRATLGLGRVGSYAGNGSGDLFVAFSTANRNVSQSAPATLQALANDQLDPLFLATVQAVEESIVNALVAARTMTGFEGHRAVAIDHEELKSVLRKYGRLGS